jgi:hypothetical protein
VLNRVFKIVSTQKKFNLKLKTSSETNPHTGPLNKVEADCKKVLKQGQKIFLLIPTVERAIKENSISIGLKGIPDLWKVICLEGKYCFTPD